jgi:hypothetical protein
MNFLLILFLDGAGDHDLPVALRTITLGCFSGWRLGAQLDSWIRALDADLYGFAHSALLNHSGLPSYGSTSVLQG